MLYATNAHQCLRVLKWRACTHSDSICVRSCSEDEIKQELNARGYVNVLDMNPDVAFELLFTKLSGELAQEDMEVRPVHLLWEPQAPSNPCLVAVPPYHIGWTDETCCLACSCKGSVLICPLVHGSPLQQESQGPSKPPLPLLGQIKYGTAAATRV